MTYKVSITGEEFSVTANNCSEGQVGAMLELRGHQFERLERATGNMEAAAIVILRQSLQQLQPRTNLEMALIIGNYLHTHERYETLTTALLRAKLVEAQEQIPRDLSAVLARGLFKGHLAEDRRFQWKRRRFYVTGRGRAYLSTLRQRPASTHTSAEGVTELGRQQQ